MSAARARCGIVAIGRNEGARLRTCLASAAAQCDAVVYVDSGSSDGSIALARALGAAVVELDLRTPFTAARARNAGAEWLLRQNTALEFIQFVDGDCEIAAGWIETAVARLDAEPQTAVICGRRRERFAGASIYNRMIDIEWDGPRGIVRACGGDAMFRASALGDAGGFDPALIAGEEPELCFRLRERGWQIRRIEAEMTLHDAALFHFSQWWRRAVRAGHAYAEGAWLHGGSAERYNMKPVLSILAWAVALPIAVLATAWPTGGLSLVVLSLYPLLVLRVAAGERRRGRTYNDAVLLAVYTVLAKFAQLAGVLRFWRGRLTGRRSRLIEYKGAAQSTEAATPP